MKKALPFLIILLVLLADQGLKIWIKTSFPYGHQESVMGLEWFKLRFIENDGMAFGWSFPGKAGKLLLSFFRIIVVSFLIYYILKLLKRNTKSIVLVCLGLITAGALGNIIDSIFYGVVWADINTYTGGWFEGHVVDMLYFPLFAGHLPSWLPFWGGEYFEFFSAIFNIADASISTGVLLIFIFQKHFVLSKEKEEENKEEFKDLTNNDLEGEALDSTADL